MIWNSDDDESPRRYWAIALLVILAAASAYVWWPRGKIYPEVSSKESLQLIKQLYTACNTRDTQRLSKIEVELRKLVTQGKVSEVEQQAYTIILEKAKTGDWMTAQADSLRFVRDQVR